MPSLYSISMVKPLPSSTVTTPSRPTLSKASAILAPISPSPAEMVATWVISSWPLMGLLSFLISATMASTPLSSPRLINIGLAPAVIFFMPWLTMAAARAVAVVVPSPAASLVFSAACLTSWAPMLAKGSASSISLATETPS